jgi:ABC-type antimicrobial peptide transport system permease subunit
MALGAQPRNILGLIVGQGARMAIAGVILGLAASFAVTRLLSSMLFEVKPSDPLVFAGVSALLLAITLLACYIPARRAMRVDPMVALHYE